MILLGSNNPKLGGPLVSGRLIECVPYVYSLPRFNLPMKLRQGGSDDIRLLVTPLVPSRILTSAL